MNLRDDLFDTPFQYCTAFPSLPSGVRVTDVRQKRGRARAECYLQFRCDLDRHKSGKICFSLVRSIASVTWAQHRPSFRTIRFRVEGSFALPRDRGKSTFRDGETSKTWYTVSLSA